MGKTYRHATTKYEDDKQLGRKGKHHHHSNNRKSGGMKIVNPSLYEEDDDFFEDEVQVTDTIRINKNGEDIS